MTPAPANRYRYNANKLEANSNLPRKSVRKTVEPRKTSVAKSSSNEPKKRILPVPTELSKAIPSVQTAFKVFLSARFCSAIWLYITDCDETFNYWEPLHYIIYGCGLQTWEYSPIYALRSYYYLLIQAIPGWIYEKIFQPNPLFVFYFTRCILAIICAIVERCLYKAIAKEFGIHIARLWLIFQLFSVGMFISSTALLPSSFSMYFANAALAAWWNQRKNLAIFFTAISAILGWPFAVIMGLPIAIDMIVRSHDIKNFIFWSLISLATILLPMILVDSYFFGTLTVSPWNLVFYNMFTNHGPNLYGTEPWYFYIINGFLNYNIIWILAILTPVMLLLQYFFIPSKVRSTLNYPIYLSLMPLYLWLFIFILQPHKEERFLFPIYPLIALCGAITVDIIQKILYRVKILILHLKTGIHYLDDTMTLAFAIMLINALLGVSRIYALYNNYHAPMDLFMNLNEFKNSPTFNEGKIYNVCIGKDWYRYPSSFFMPSKNFRVRFLKSEFRGILPAYYSELKDGTKIVHPYFNDENKEDERMYFDYNKCHFLVDLNLGKHTDDEPNYSNNTKSWELITSLPYLIAEKSHKLFRSFYVPYFSDQYTTFGSLNLLKRKDRKIF